MSRLSFWIYATVVLVAIWGAFRSYRIRGKHHIDDSAVERRIGMALLGVGAAIQACLNGEWANTVAGVLELCGLLWVLGVARYGARNLGQAVVRGTVATVLLLVVASMPVLDRWFGKVQFALEFHGGTPPRISADTSCRVWDARQGVPHCDGHWEWHLTPGEQLDAQLRVVEWFGRRDSAEVFVSAEAQPGPACAGVALRWTMAAGEDQVTSTEPALGVVTPVTVSRGAHRLRFQASSHGGAATCVVVVSVRQRAL